MPVPEQLHLDVSWAPQEALAVDRAVAERRLGLARGGLERVGEVVGALDDAHPTAAAARGRLDEQGEAELLGRPGRERRHARRGGDALRLELVAASAQDVGRRPDPHRAASVTDSANGALSARKPYPGWTSVAPESVAAATSASASRYDGTATTESATRAWKALSSPGPVTATVPIPSRRHVEKMRTAISPRFATSSFRAALTAATLED